jgi:hypothetical protein
VAKQNFPKDRLRGPYSGYLLRWQQRGVEAVLTGCCGGMLVDRKRRSRGRTGRNKPGTTGQAVRDLAGHPDYTAPPGKDAVTPPRTRK